MHKAIPANAQPLRILMVTPRFHPLIGGVETHTLEVARRLVTHGHQVTVLTTNAGKQLPAVDVINGIHVRRVQVKPSWSDLHIAPGIYQTIVQHAHQWDLVHCQGYHTMVPPIAMRAARRAGVPYLVTFHSGGHSSSWRNAIRRLQRRILRPLLASASGLIAVSRFEAALFARDLNYPDSRFTIIPNGVALPRPVSLPASDPQRPLILSVGRLERYKGHHRLIEAFPLVLNQLPGARLRIVGTGPFEPQLQRLVAELGLETVVRIEAISNDDRAGLANLMAASAVIALLSDYEAHPLAILEALYLQRPVLVTHTPGLAEFAEMGQAESIPLNADRSDVAAAIVKIVQQPPTMQPVQLPTWDACLTQLLKLYYGSTRTHQPA